MSRLIDAEKLIEIFNHDLKCFETDGKTEEKMYISVADMRKMINEQPTAYDVEKVVAELEQKRIEYESYSENAPDDISKTYRKGVMRGYEYSKYIVKDIVRKGEVE